MLVIRNFSKTYNDVTILSIEQLQLTEGLHWFKGENGSGKTTFFKSIAGLLPHQGDICFDDGLSLKNNPVEYRKLVNYGEAEPLYPGFLTAKDLIRFIGKAKGASAQQQKDIAEVFGIDKYFEKSCDTYSSGMLKKLSLALAFLGKPRVIILDEPLNTLDEQARNVLMASITEAISKQHVSFLVSSHQLIEHTSIVIKETYQIHNHTIASV